MNLKERIEERLEKLVITPRIGEKDHKFVIAQASTDILKAIEELLLGEEKIEEIIHDHKQVLKYIPLEGKPIYWEIKELAEIITKAQRDKLKGEG
ncbi:MAG: hypothetical protein KKB31_06395 [Nanoarchaeota archaeon]|nr:hypothetical protein [Nanoarchaeota archaeon]